jgi:hypothetical protein
MALSNRSPVSRSFGNIRGWTTNVLGMSWPLLLGNIQPPYSPELNPIEQLWSLLKGQLSNRLWFVLDELQQALSHQLRQLTRDALRSLMLRQTLLEAFSWAGMSCQAA